MSADRKREIVERLHRTRERTLRLLEHVPDEFFRRRVHSFYSPVGWHFGHIGRTEEHWACVVALGLAPSDEHLHFRYADTPDNPKDERVDVLERDHVVDYLRRTRERSEDALHATDIDGPAEFVRGGYAWEFAVQHEMQHQETILEMLHLIQLEIARERSPELNPPIAPQAPEPEWVAVPGGAACLGSDEPFVYDNEREVHTARLEPFALARRPVTVAEWTAFIAERAYERQELWSPEGWAWREAEGASRPFYWLGDGTAVGPYGARALRAQEPVCGVGHHEAQAFARWAGARLPTEAEWEAAANSEPGGRRRFPWGDATFAIEDVWKPNDAGAERYGSSALGLLDMAGGVWEHCSSAFLPYSGFRAYPYAGYSKDHMDGRHFVVRGGSWATAPDLCRCSFRNWYVPTYRQGFLGVRLAQ